MVHSLEHFPTENLPYKLYFIPLYSEKVRNSVVTEHEDLYLHS